MIRERGLHFLSGGSPELGVQYLIVSPSAKSTFAIGVRNSMEWMDVEYSDVPTEWMDSAAQNASRAIPWEMMHTQEELASIRGVMSN